MTKLEEYREIRAKVKEKEEKLQSSIDEDTASLLQMESDYKKALTEDREKEADKLFPKMEDTKSRLASNKQKQRTLKEVNHNRIYEGAKAAVSEIIEIRELTKREADPVLKEIETMADQMEEKIIYLNKLSGEYSKEREVRSSLASRMNLDTGGKLEQEVKKAINYPASVIPSADIQISINTIKKAVAANENQTEGVK